MKIRAVWQFFETEADGELLHLFVGGTQEPVHTFRFARQRQGDYLCLSDYVLPQQNGRRDHLAMFVVTAGEGGGERSEKEENERYYFKLHGLQALAIETRETRAGGLALGGCEDLGVPRP